MAICQNVNGSSVPLMGVVLLEIIMVVLATKSTTSSIMPVVGASALLFSLVDHAHIWATDATISVSERARTASIGMVNVAVVLHATCIVHSLIFRRFDKFNVVNRLSSVLAVSTAGVGMMGRMSTTVSACIWAGLLSLSLMLVVLEWPEMSTDVSTRSQRGNSNRVELTWQQRVASVAPRATFCVGALSAAGGSVVIGVSVDCGDQAGVGFGTLLYTALVGYALYTSAVAVVLLECLLHGQCPTVDRSHGAASIVYISLRTTRENVKIGDHSHPEPMLVASTLLSAPPELAPDNAPVVHAIDTSLVSAHSLFAPV
jgi:hypothetical protein